MSRLIFRMEKRLLKVWKVQRRRKPQTLDWSWQGCTPTIVTIKSVSRIPRKRPQNNILVLLLCFYNFRNQKH
ncbi:hypothetical protein BRARA_I03000 [Brassica rapa]|uniref:Uncharacterized protein n=1 Tax=Brassica campestris TaxID=3711 RepID=A0A397Y0M8_BRACM|nr:hypothetical protein BRARA_I03000 [Brassica rapa]